MAKQTLSWENLPETVLSDSVQAKIKALREMWARHRAESDPAKAAIQAEIAADYKAGGGKVPAGTELVIGFNFGKVGVAFAPIVPAKAAKVTGSIGQALLKKAG